MGISVLPVRLHAGVGGQGDALSELRDRGTICRASGRTGQDGICWRAASRRKVVAGDPSGVKGGIRGAGPVRLRRIRAFVIVPDVTMIHEGHSGCFERKRQQ